MFSFIRKSVVRLFNSVVLSIIIIGLTIFSIMIGAYNYNTSMQDLRNGAENITNLAAVALRQPLWDYDKAGLDGIFNAILLDADVIAIRTMNGIDAQKKQKAVESMDFPELLKNPQYISSISKIEFNGKNVADVQIITNTERAKTNIRNTTILIVLFTLVFVISLSSIIWLLGIRIIQRPINALRNSADHLANGNLTETINTSRPDELGSLAVSFDKMRNAIRKKLDDLAILNATAERLASVHDQAAALEIAINVMREQTKIARGSIYLLDDESTLTLSAFHPEIVDQVAHFSKSFKIGEGVVGQVASTEKTQFIADVSKAPNYVDLSSSDERKALLCVPMMDDKKIFGVMNFIGEVGELVSFSKEDESFALTIARMVVITLKNIQMLNVIEEQNRNLEERILQRTAELRQKTNDVNNMLQNMRQGIFTIVAGNVIHPEHSAYLEEIFETHDIADQPVFPFLFKQSDVGSDALNQMTAAIESMLGEDSMMFEFNSHLLIHEYAANFADRTKILELDWNPVLNADDTIDKMMVTVRDVTELKALQVETGKQKEELDIIGQILAVSRSKLLEFISTSYQFLDENKTLIENNPESKADIIATLFLNMHTIKGNARTYGFTYITDCVHEAESTYNLIKSGEYFLWDQVHLLEQLQAVRDCVVRYETVLKEKLASFSENESFGIAQSVIDEIAQVVDVVNEMSQIATLKSSLLSIKQSINTVRSESIQQLLNGILRGVPSMAKQLGKETPTIDIVDNAIRVNKDIVPILRNVFMHIFRNAMDHGLESTETRIARGKPIHGQISLEVSLHDDTVAFTFQDDGKGLALERIYEKAVANGQISPDQAISDEQVADLIFHSGLSTAETVSNLSGRGVGMDAVRQFLNKHQGDIQLAFTAEKANDGFRAFKQIITLPSKFAFKST